ncbi:MAG TPA: hypothetical protein DCL44_09405 [Elusimicrobia bacterium]|nr:hypothetical protein [Elusimicrobiota bacterium]
MNANILFTLALLMFPATLNAQSKNSQTFEKFICDGNFFAAMIPSGWDKQEEILLGRQEKQYGVDLTYTNPKTRNIAFPSISLIYFGPDHLRFKTPAEYIGASLQTRKKIKDETATAPRHSTFNGRKAQVFEKITYSSIPKMALMFEKHVVMPAKKGFFVLSFQAPNDAAKDYLKIFDKVIASFKPNI